MYGWFYRGSELVMYPLVGMFLFIGVFVAVVLRTYARGRRPSLDAAAALPLADDAIGDAHSMLGLNTGEHHGK